MKAITEERLREILSSFDGLSGDVVCSKQSMLEYLIGYQLEEIDTLTVPKLRPMCDAPKVEDILVKIKDKDKLVQAFCDDGLCYAHENWFVLDAFEGWIPMPIYKPEEK